MVARATFKGVRCVLLTVMAMSPTALLAQQDNVSKSPEPHQAEPAQEKRNAVEGQTEKPQTEAAKTQEDSKLISVQGGKALGMSILGNQEAPKALVIVPWKQSELGNALDISTMLDDSRLPIDKEVFMRMLSYYEIRSGVTPTAGAPAGKNASPDSTANGRKK